MIVAMLNALSAGVTGSTNDLLLSPDKYNHSLWQAALLINNVAVKPISAIVLAIMLVLMLASNSTRIEGDSQMGVRIIAGTMFKAVIVLAVAGMAVYFLDAINAIGTSIGTAANNVSFGGGSHGSDPKLGDQMSGAIGDAGTLQQIGMFIVIMIPWAAIEVVGVLSTVLIFVRFLQLYMLTAFASLPVVFFGHEETKSISIGYLKRYAATIIQGVVLIIAVKLYQALLSGWLGSTVKYHTGDDAWGFIVGNFGNFIVAPAVLAFLLFGANSVAKAIVGEG